MNEGAVIAEREAFCKRLKFAREASGQTLEAISDASKIQVSLLARLERGDMSRWPNGIFRRAFIREYASAIGLPVEQVVNEFTRLFPDDGTAPVVQGSLLLPDSFEDLRLTLAPDNPWSLGVTRTRALAVLADVAVGIVTIVEVWARSNVMELGLEIRKVLTHLNARLKDAAFSDLLGPVKYSLPDRSFQ
jgi:transcriptional regulator with XRE-family HTH domain